jgi:hypothetical protein
VLYRVLIALIGFSLLIILFSGLLSSMRLILYLQSRNAPQFSTQALPEVVSENMPVCLHFPVSGNDAGKLF